MYFMWVPFAGATTPPAVGGGPVALCVSGCAATLRQTLEGLPLTALASAWSITDGDLTCGPDSERIRALVTLRALILDEVEQRFPRHYRVWLRWGGPHGIRPYGDLIMLV